MLFSMFVHVFWKVSEGKSHIQFSYLDCLSCSLMLLNIPVFTPENLKNEDPPKSCMDDSSCNFESHTACFHECFIFPLLPMLWSIWRKTNWFRLFFPRITSH